MNKWVVEPRPIDRDADRREALARNLEQLAWLMDRAVHIPGTRITLGLDAILGLLPIGGDVLTGFVQAGLVLAAIRCYNLPKHVAARMAANVLIDIAVGAIPILGDLFDIGFKANTRNIQLLEPYRHQDPWKVREAGMPAPSAIDFKPFPIPWRYLLPIGAILFVALALVLIGFVTVVRWLFRF